LTADGEQYLGFITDASRRMSDLISGILEYSRLTTSMQDKFEPVEISEVITDVLKNLHASIEQTQARISFDELPVVSQAVCN
jgi:light-regulated signal transduction histidine kinase (bacteriophytochrome)